MSQPSESYTTEVMLPVVYDELRRLAAGRLMKGGALATLQPTALVREAWIQLAGRAYEVCPRMSWLRRPRA